MTAFEPPWPLADGIGRPEAIGPADVRWLAWHETCAHALGGREVRDLGDGWMLHDPTDREPFWNRVAGAAWPGPAGAFDRRLTEILALFAVLDRIPHVWAFPGFDEPPDLTERLLANGFVDHGGGIFMALDPERWTADGPPVPDGVTIERLHDLRGDEALRAATAIATVLVGAFAVERERQVAIELEAVQGLADSAYHAVLARVDGVPAAVARRTTFAGACYLSSIGTDPAYRGRGLGRLVTAVAAADALAAGSHWTYLGVFADNAVARSLYADLGFVEVGGVNPDLLLRP
jgi:ribosomal protein S18 acetylase RimI-like enzyme